MINPTTFIFLNSRNKTRLKKLGYNVPENFKRGAKLEIAVEHLSKGSRTKVTRICDSCGKVDRVCFRDLGSKELCKKCSAKALVGEKNPFYGKQHTQKTKEKLSKLNKISDLEECEIIKKLESLAISPTSDKASELLGYHKMPILNILNRNGRRDLLFQNKTRSGYELELLEILKKDYKGQIELNYRGLQDVYEVDLFFPEKGLAVELNGLWWHSEKYKDKKDHQNKYLACLQQGVKLLTIWEHTWLNRKDAVIKLIKAHLGLSQKTYARKCKLNFDQKMLKAFMEDNHIQGAHPNHRLLGLEDAEGLVLAVSWGAHHRGGTESEVLSRVCFSDKRVVGGLDKLLKHIPAPTLITWSDNCYSPNPTLYKNSGFRKVVDLAPDYFYTRGYGKAFSKQSQAKSRVDCPSDKTEATWAKERGLYRVWDCGKVKWELKRPRP